MTNGKEKRPVGGDGLSLWDNLCIHAAFHWWNPIGFFLREEWVFEVWLQNGLEYPGWRWR